MAKKVMSCSLIILVILLVFVAGCDCWVGSPYTNRIISAKDDSQYVIFEYVACGDWFIEGSDFEKCEKSRMSGFEFWFPHGVKGWYNEKTGTPILEIPYIENIPNYEIVSRKILEPQNILRSHEIHYEIRVKKDDLLALIENME